MRIAIVEPAAGGGLLHYAAQLADALAERGHDVELIAARGNELSERPGRARMRAILTPPVRDWTQAPPSSRVPRTLRRAGVMLRLIPCWSRVGWEIVRRRYDVMVLGDVALPPVTLMALGLTALRGRTAIVELCHNVKDGIDSRVERPLLGRFFERCDRVLVHGESSVREFEQLWPPASLGEVPHGDERLFGEPPPPAPHEHVLFFGNWHRVKGLPVLMDAWEQLAERRPDARLTIAGRPFPDGEPERVREFAARYADRVSLVDRYVPVEEVNSIFSDARVVVTPYVEASQSGVIHTAMTMARPVVTSDVGELGRTVVDGRTGRVVPPRDPDALAAALEQVLADPELAERMGAEGRRVMMNGSSWERVAERFEQELELALERRR